MKANSYLALVIGVAAPLITPLIPQLQSMAQSNVWASALFAAGLILWNHFVAPVHK